MWTAYLLICLMIKFITRVFYKLGCKVSTIVPPFAPICKRKGKEERQRFSSSDIVLYCDSHPKWIHLICIIPETPISVRSKLWSSVSTERLGYYTLNSECSWKFRRIPICGSYFSGGNKSAIPGRLVRTVIFSLGNYTFNVTTMLLCT